MPEPGDPRTYFAAERTLLAWVRTGLGVIGLGFDMARFGLFLRMLRSGPAASGVTGSAVFGVAFVLLWAAIIATAAWQHARFCRTLGSENRPSDYSLRMGSGFAFTLAAGGVGLSIYLILRELQWALLPD